MAELALFWKKPLTETSFYYVKIWNIPKSENFPEGVKYSMAIVDRGKVIVRFDNERGKGHHKHYGGTELPVKFQSVEELLESFFREVKAFRGEKNEG